MEFYLITEWTVTAPSLLGFRYQETESGTSVGDREASISNLSFFCIVWWENCTESQHGYGTRSTETYCVSYRICLLQPLGNNHSRLGSDDDRVVDYYLEIIEVREGQGPKPGRHAFSKDKNVTFRQLIANTSGYMKPKEKSGKTEYLRLLLLDLHRRQRPRAFRLVMVATIGKISRLFKKIGWTIEYMEA